MSTKAQECTMKTPALFIPNHGQHPHRLYLMLLFYKKEP